MHPTATYRIQLNPDFTLSDNTILTVGTDSNTGKMTTALMMHREMQRRGMNVAMIGWVIVVAAAAAMGQVRRINADRLGSHAVRNVFHFTGQFLWFWAITMIPLAQVFALEFTSPIPDAMKLQPVDLSRWLHDVDREFVRLCNDNFGRLNGLIYSCQDYAAVARR